MLNIAAVNENNKQEVIGTLMRDPIRHVFALFDLQHKPEHTTCHVAYENQKLEGYVMIYRALGDTSVVLECPPAIAAELLTYAPEDHFIMHSPPELLQAIKSKYPYSKHYVEAWMLVKRGQATAYPSSNVRRLSLDDAQQLANLLSTRTERATVSLATATEWLREQPIYGVFIGDNIVSYAGSFLQTPQVWMIGGVYTHPRHRNRGYATEATSAITQEALANAESAALFARADNDPAIRAYGKIGYRKIGEKLWTDQGTGHRP